MNSFRDRLAHLMDIRGLSGKGGQSELARLVGCKPQVIQYLLSPSNNPKGSKYTLAIARVLLCDPNWLECGVGQEPGPLDTRDGLLVSDPEPIYKAGSSTSSWPFSVPIERVLALPPRVIGKIDGYIEHQVEEHEREADKQKAA